MQTHFNDFEMWQQINKRLMLFAVQDGEYKFGKSEIRKQTEIGIIINELYFFNNCYPFTLSRYNQ